MSEPMNKRDKNDLDIFRKCLLLELSEVNKNLTRIARLLNSLADEHGTFILDDSKWKHNMENND